MFNFRMGVGITLGGGHGFVMARLPSGGWSAPLLIMVDQGALLFDLARTAIAHACGILRWNADGCCCRCMLLPLVIGQLLLAHSRSFNQVSN